MDTTLKDRVIERMGVMNLTNAQLASVCGVKQPTSFHWASGKTKNIKGEPLLKAAKAFGVTPEWLASGKGPKYPSNVVAGDKHTVNEPGGFAAANNATPMGSASLSTGPTTVSLDVAVARIGQFLEGLGDYDKRTAESLLTTLAHSPYMHETVSQGLTQLAAQAREDPPKHLVPASNTVAAKSARSA